MIDWTTVLSESISGLVVGLILAVLGYVFLDKYAQRIAFAEKMSEHGFSNMSLKKQSEKEIKKMCDHAEMIKLINVSGLHFLTDNRYYIIRALKRNCDIRFLCANPESSFITDIEQMENCTFDAKGKPLRRHDDHIRDEIERLTSDYRRFGMKVRYYSSEYRLPFVLAYYPDGTIEAWLTLTLPPYKSTRSIVLRGKREEDAVYSDELNFVEMMEKHFDTIWNRVSTEPAGDVELVWNRD